MWVCKRAERGAAPYTTGDSCLATPQAAACTQGQATQLLFQQLCHPNPLPRVSIPLAHPELPAMAGAPLGLSSWGRVASKESLFSC